MQPRCPTVRTYDPAPYGTNPPLAPGSVVTDPPFDSRTPLIRLVDLCGQAQYALSTDPQAFALRGTSWRPVRSTLGTRIKRWHVRLVGRGNTVTGPVSGATAASQYRYRHGKAGNGQPIALQRRRAELIRRRLWIRTRMTPSLGWLQEQSPAVCPYRSGKAPRSTTAPAS